ncbi:MAG: hypothetical protein AAFV30_08030, partial [Pseudomonadota bacterium]
MTALRTALLAFTLTCASSALADFGDYESHTLDGQTLRVETTRGTLTLELINATSMAAHYVEPGV